MLSAGSDSRLLFDSVSCDTVAAFACILSVNFDGNHSTFSGSLFSECQISRPIWMKDTNETAMRI